MSDLSKPNMDDLTGDPPPLVPSSYAGELEFFLVLAQTPSGAENLLVGMVGLERALVALGNAYPAATGLADRLANIKASQWITPEVSRIRDLRATTISSAFWSVLVLAGNLGTRVCACMDGQLALAALGVLVLRCRVSSCTASPSTLAKLRRRLSNIQCALNGIESMRLSRSLRRDLAQLAQAILSSPEIASHLGLPIAWEQMALWD